MEPVPLPMKTVSCPSCGSDIQPTAVNTVQFIQCNECGCGAWSRVILALPRHTGGETTPLVTHWAEDVFENETRAESVWPLSPWHKI